jgi:hypothetical protein
VEALHQFGFKVFMDARMPVTHEEGDRYPLRPPEQMEMFAKAVPLSQRL